MHAYLFVGGNGQERDAKALELSKQLSHQTFEFSVEKVEEVRNLGNFTRLSFETPTCIVVKELQNSTQEALNAFLKNLEEPQKNITYILTSSSEHKLLPTILSRCQVVRINPKSTARSYELALDFLRKSHSEKLKAIDTIRGREEATMFLEELALSIHSLLVVENKKNLKFLTGILKNVQKSLNAINANGNVTLQLTNFVVNLEDFDLREAEFQV